MGREGGEGRGGGGGEGCRICVVHADSDWKHSRKVCYHLDDAASLKTHVEMPEVTAEFLNPLKSD